MNQVSESDNSTELQMTARKRLDQFAIAVIGTSFFFWVWALWNIISGKVPFDLGIVSFATSALSSFYLLKKTKSMKRKISSFTKYLCLSSYVFVAINYALGALIGVRNDWAIFSVYCVIFTLLWIVVTIVGNSIIRSYQLLND